MIKAMMRIVKKAIGRKRKPELSVGSKSGNRKTDAVVADIEASDALRRKCAERVGLGTGSSCASSGEAGALRFLGSQLPRSSVLFDVGANAGEYSCLLAEHFPEAAIYSFEPSPRTYAILKNRVAHLQRVQTFCCGLSSSDSEARLYSNAEGSGLASMHKRRLAHFGIAFDQSEPVTMTTVDGFSDEQSIGRIDFLKIDVEGHELEVLKGAEKRLAADRISAIQFEFGGCNIDSRTFFQDFYYLLSERYYLCRILQEGLYRIDQYRETDEVFVTTNYLALHKQRFPVVQNSRMIQYG